MSRSVRLAQIEQAFSRGDLDQRRRLNQIADVLLAYDERRDAHAVDDRIKCAAGYMLHLQRHAAELSGRNRSLLAAASSRPELQFNYNTPQGHFKIHYDVAGDQAVYQAGVDINPADGHPDFINRVGDYFEYAWSLLIEDMGFLAPPPDGKGGDDRYDVYMKAYPQAYGVAIFEDPSDQYADHLSWTSFIEMHPDFAGFAKTPDESAQVTSVHEFFHAVQGAYSIAAATWFMEATATWIEDLGWDDVNDYYAYLPDFFRRPDRSLQTFDGSHEYAACVWPHYLGQRFGAATIRDIWRASIQKDVLTATDDVLRQKGADLDAAFIEFSLWNYLTGRRADTSLPHYEEAQHYPMIAAFPRHDVYPIENFSPDAGQTPEPLAANYVSCVLDSSDDFNVLFFYGNPAYEWGLTAVAVFPDGLEHLSPRFVSQNEARIDFPTEAEQVVFIPSQLASPVMQRGEYNYSVRSFASDHFLLALDETMAGDLNVTDDNDRLQAGETGALRFRIYNYGETIGNVQASIVIDDPTIHIAQPSLFIDRIDSGAFILGAQKPFVLDAPQNFPVQKVSGELALQQGDVVVEFPFTFVVGIPDLLLIADDKDAAARRFYAGALDSLGLLHDICDGDSLSDLHLAARRNIILTDPGLSRSVFDQLEDQSLLFAGVGLGENEAVRTFVHDYLHADIKGGVPAFMVQGRKDEYISRGMLAGFSADFREQRVDALEPLQDAQVVFDYVNQDYAAALKTAAKYRAVYFAFPLHQLVDDHPYLTSPRDILARSLAWLDGVVVAVAQQHASPGGGLAAYPNPFNAGVVVRVAGVELKNTRLEIYNIRGRRVRVLHDGPLSGGERLFHWDGADDAGTSCSVGAYFVRLVAGEQVYSRKIFLLK